MEVPNKLVSNWRLNTCNNFEREDEIEIYSEQVRENTQSYSQFSGINETPKFFQSTSTSQPFRCNVHAIDPSKVVVFYESPESQQVKKYISEKEIRFPIHPGNENAPQIEAIQTLPVVDTVTVFPTASTRSVRVWDHTSKDCLKFDLHLRISRFIRCLSARTIRRSIEVSRRLSNYLSNTNDPHTAIMKEDLGVAFLTQQNPVQGWGFLHRDMELFPRSNEKTFSIPMFSLYGIDPAHPETPPLLIQILDQCDSNRERIDTVLNHVFFPIIRSWTAVFQNTGIVLEPHGQNAL